MAHLESFLRRSFSKLLERVVRRRPHQRGGLAVKFASHKVAGEREAIEARGASLLIRPTARNTE
jgi:hypothetical protein